MLLLRGTRFYSVLFFIGLYLGLCLGLCLGLRAQVGGLETVDPNPELSCHENVKCLSERDERLEGYQAVRSAVVRLSIDLGLGSGVGSVTCTGVLLNNVKEDGMPYVLTANHCLMISDDDNNKSYQIYDAEEMGTLSYKGTEHSANESRECCSPF